MNKDKLRILRELKRTFLIETETREVLRNQLSPEISGQLYRLSKSIKGAGQLTNSEILFSIWKVIEENDAWDEIGC